MANATRNLTLLIVLVVGIGVGWLIGHAKTPPTPPPPPPDQVTPTLTPVPQSTPTPTPICKPDVTPTVAAKHWKLVVGPNPCDVTENSVAVPLAVISKQGKHKIEFRSNAGQTLAIIVHVPRNAPKPFQKMAFAGYDSKGLALWVLVCDDPKKPCSTGPAEEGSEYTCYKYDQVLDGKLCDAGIIIEK